MDQQIFFNIVVGICGTISFFVLNLIRAAIRDLQVSDKKLADELSQTNVLMAGTCVKKGEWDSLIDALFKKLDKMEDKQDRMAEKLNNKADR